VTAPVAQIARASGRGRQPAFVERMQELADELVARDAEYVDLADELTALSRRIQLAIHAERPDVALHVAGRLDALAASLRRRSAA
jgi:hypothetical protein